jgi:hypothetical protein
MAGVPKGELELPWMASQCSEIPIAGKLAGNFFSPGQNPRVLPIFRNSVSGAGNEQGLCREFAIFDPTESKQEGYEENQDLAPLSREFAGNFFEGGTIFHA